jgi:drug/metabolite transporter (DMT)-like permease
LFSGAVLYGWGFRVDRSRPTRRQWCNALIAGFLMFVVGNGGVTWAEQSVPSGLAALIVATLPVWLLVIDWSLGGRRRPAVVEIAGIVLGLAGVAVLVAPAEGDAVSHLGIGALVLSAIAWAVGSLFIRHADLPRSAIRTGAMQMLAGGAIMVAIGLVAGESARISPATISRDSMLAFAYLVVVAVVAVPAYTWLLTVSSPAIVGTYAFVNPAVAVVLGWAFAGETLNERTGASVVLVIAGVTLLCLFGKRAAEPAPIPDRTSGGN